MTTVRTEVAGVAAVHEETDDGPCSGGLVFRVGWADETLALRGLTHLVTHLALSDLPAGEVHRHVDTFANHTVLRADGSFAEVAEFVGRVCAALKAPPTHAIDGAKAVLAAETVAAGPVGGRTQGLRYGARGYGLSAYPEIGLPEIDAPLVEMWAAETFTRDNAVVWFRGPGAPETIPLPLPEGRRQPLPPVPPALERFPAFVVTADTGTVLVTGTVPRSPAAALFAEVLDAALDAALCRRTDYCVRAGATYDVRDAETATVVVRAHSRPDRHAETVGELVDVLARLGHGSLEAGELDGARAALAGRRDDVESVIAVARDLLLAPGTAGPPEDDPAALAAVTREDVHALADAFERTALAELPDVGLGWLGWHEAAPRPVGLQGTGPAEGVLELDEGGATLVRGDVSSSVRFDEVAVMIAYADGGRWLVGEDGSEVHVEPVAHRLEPDAVEAVDRAVDVARVVHRPARDIEDIPAPTELPAPSTEPHEGIAGRLLGRLRTRR